MRELVARLERLHREGHATPIDHRDEARFAARELTPAAVEAVVPVYLAGGTTRKKYLGYRERAGRG